MIVNKRELGWEIIRQPAHALLAMELFIKLNIADFSHEEVASIFAAIALHDDQESYYEKGSYLSQEGAPLDFAFLPMNARTRTDQAVRIVHSGFLKSALVGSLILEHFTCLYEDKKIESEMRAALKKARKNKEKLIRQGHLERNRIQKCYTVMGFCDRLSLILCKAEIPAMARSIEIETLADTEASVFLKQNEKGILTCHPWAFADNTFTVSVESFRTQKLTFESDSDLKQFLTTKIPEKKYSPLRKLEKNLKSSKQIPRALPTPIVQYERMRC